MFQTEPAWEFSAGIEMLRALAGQAELRQYRMFELVTNVPIYRLDLVLPEKFSKDQVLRRLRLQSLLEALEFIRDHNPVEVRLSQETAFDDERPDEVRRIQSVSIGRTSAGERVFVCERSTGHFCVDVNGDEYDADVKIEQRIWPRTGTMAVAVLPHSIHRDER